MKLAAPASSHPTSTPGQANISVVRPMQRPQLASPQNAISIPWSLQHSGRWSLRHQSSFMISSVLEFQHTAEMSPAGEAPASTPSDSSSTGNLVFPQGFSLQ